MLLRTILALVSAALLWPSSADAQIYAWRDANGTMVLSDRRLGAEAKTYAVPDSSAIRSTRPAASVRIREQYEPMVLESARVQGVRPDLVRAVIQVESGFNPRARSPKGAMGLMQLMPATAAELGVSNAFDPAQNIRGGTAYLRQLLDRYDGDETLALAAYNAGSGAVDRHGKKVPPFRETRDYVKKVGTFASLTSAAVDADPAPSAGSVVVYKSVEIINGQPVSRYSSQRPSSGSYQVIQR